MPLSTVGKGLSLLGCRRKLEGSRPVLFIFLFNLIIATLFKYGENKLLYTFIIHLEMTDMETASMGSTTDTAIEIAETIHLFVL
jgi:hypothetical protein